jgi:hypothetical protein
MEFEWDETKRQSNIRDHRIDFVDAAQLFEALIGFQGLLRTWVSATHGAWIKLLKNKSFKEDIGRTNRVGRHGDIHDPGIQQEPSRIGPKPTLVSRAANSSSVAVTSIRAK